MWVTRSWRIWRNLAPLRMTNSYVRPSLDCVNDSASTRSAECARHRPHQRVVKGVDHHEWRGDALGRLPRSLIREVLTESASQPPPTCPSSLRTREWASRAPAS